MRTSRPQISITKRVESPDKTTNNLRIGLYSSNAAPWPQVPNGASLEILVWCFTRRIRWRSSRLHCWIALWGEWLAGGRIHEMQMQPCRRQACPLMRPSLIRLLCALAWAPVRRGMWDRTVVGLLQCRFWVQGVAFRPSDTGQGFLLCCGILHRSLWPPFPRSILSVPQGTNSLWLDVIRQPPTHWFCTP